MDSTSRTIACDECRRRKKRCEHKMSRKPALARKSKSRVKKERVSSSQFSSSQLSSSQLSPWEQPCSKHGFANSSSSSPESTRSRHSQYIDSTVRTHMSEADKYAKVSNWQSMAACCALGQGVFDDSYDWDWDDWLTPEGKTAFGLM
jgi:hypothetical protein